MASWNELPPLAEDPEAFQEDDYGQSYLPAEHVPISGEEPIPGLEPAPIRAAACGTCLGSGTEARSYGLHQWDIPVCRTCKGSGRER